MVGKKTLQDYELTTIEEYFNVVIDSRVNGNSQQAKNQFSKLSEEQRLEFLDYLKELGMQEDIYNFFLKCVYYRYNKGR